MQDAFVRVLERWDRVALMEDPRGYLYRTAMNAFRSRYRRALLASRRVTKLRPADDAIARIDEHDAAVRARADLSPRQRAAVVLTDLLGFRSEAAARMLGIRASTLRMHASRAHAALNRVQQSHSNPAFDVDLAVDHQATIRVSRGMLPRRDRRASVVAGRDQVGVQRELQRGEMIMIGEDGSDLQRFRGGGDPAWQGVLR